MELTKEQEVLQQVINKAWENEDFKGELMENPVAAIENLTGEKLDLKGKKLIVRDQTDEKTIYINIPAQQNLEDIELNEEQLEAVAGGKPLNEVIGYGDRPFSWVTFDPNKPILKIDEPQIYSSDMP